MREVIASTYEVLEQLGAGGGGVVYLANHLRLNKKVVLKADKRKITTKPELLRREVDVLKNLSHPYIPQVYDFFVEEDTVYTVMEYIEGESLDKPLKRGEKYSQPQVIAWARQILEALCYLHSPTHGEPPRGYVHSDIKPANLMRRPDNTICLIDFNIALALGEKNVIGCSPGYASPEHYGLDFSSGSDTVAASSGSNASRRENDDRTVPAREWSSSSGSSMNKKIIIPDVRSDIYSTGATLYHLLSGKRPARDAEKVEPLSAEAFSPAVVQIISKAMNPNPDLRYQTADEMLMDFNRLHQNDIRRRRLNRARLVWGAFFGICLIAGAALSFIGLRRMQVTESLLKLAEYSRTALAEGDRDRAVEYALQAIPASANLLTPPAPPEAQAALTQALGVYDLRDCFQAEGRLELPSAPFDLEVSPEGTRFAAVYAYEVAVYDTASQQKLAALPIQESALSDCVFVDEDRIIYAGAEGVTAYDLNHGEMIWTGDTATTLAVSGDGRRVAAVNRDDGCAAVYDTGTGERIAETDFGGLHLSVASNDRFADPEDNIFALNENGSLLAVSFSNGALTVFNLTDPDSGLIVYEDSPYRHFEGGFCGKYFAFTAAGGSSQFGLVDTEEGVYLGGYDSQEGFLLQADETGIYLAKGNVLARLDPSGAAEGNLEETELAYTGDYKIQNFSLGEEYVIAATEDNRISFYDSGAHLSSAESCGDGCDFLKAAGNYVLSGNHNETYLRLFCLEDHAEAELLQYDARYEHDEARVGGDGQTAMLFSIDGFRIYDLDGNLVNETVLPDTDTIYDQQFRRSKEQSWLEVIWYDGTVRKYSAQDGSLLSESREDAPDESLYEEFFTEKYRFASSLHGGVKVYDLKSDKEVPLAEEDAYLTYVTQTGEYIVTEYLSTNGGRYGVLRDEKLRELARLPDLSDIREEGLVFDYESGDLRQCRLYSLQELAEIGRETRGKESR